MNLDLNDLNDLDVSDVFKIQIARLPTNPHEVNPMATWTRFLTAAATTLALALVILAPMHLRATAQEAPSHTPEKNIVEVAVAGGFDTLVAAVKAAGLVEMLQGDGPFTVFAPTDEAFAKLPTGTVENLLQPENKDQLLAILAYHVVPARVTAAEVVNLDTAPTLQGATLDIETENGAVQINNATVTATDIEATNGIVHVIDTVLLPPSNN